MNKRAVLWTLLLLVLAGLSVGTVRNTLKTNQANAKLAQQAADGAVALRRSCRLAGVSKKIYVDNLQRGVITGDDFALFSDTLQQACTRR